jgi:hypothetical protein
MTAALPFRITHQFRTEWRHHRGWIIAWALWVILRWLYRTQNEESVFSNLFVGDLVPLITILMAITVAWLCVRADSPSNTDCATLTRPIGQTALWLGKLAFLACCVVLPLVMVESTGWMGFQHGPVAWIALGGGWVFSAALVMGIAGALTALASNTRQIIAIAVLGVLGAGIWLTLGYAMNGTPADPKATPDAARICGGIIASALACTGVFIAWWAATVPRRRAMAAALLLLSLLQAPLIMATWKTDWITPPALAYPAAKLGVKVGKADPADKAPGRSLWPTLRITGLGKDEVASIIDFAPIEEKDIEWPPLGSYTDLPENKRGFDCWMHLDHVRALLKHSPPTTLWQHYLNNDGNYNGRLKVQEAIKPLRLDPKAMPARWLLRLAVHELRRIATVPFKQFWTQDNVFPIRPGLRIETRPFAPSNGAWELNGRLHRVHSLLLPPRPNLPAISRGQTLADAFFLVLEDPELHENAAHDLGPVRRGYMMNRHQNFALQVDESQGFQPRLWTPRVQHLILKTTHEDWVNRLNASLWHAEERGTVDLELSAEQMVQVLAEPKPEPKKP